MARRSHTRRRGSALNELNSPASAAPASMLRRQPTTATSRFPDVPAGTYQLVVFDNNMDVIFGFKGLTVNTDGSCVTFNGSCALGDVPVFSGSRDTSTGSSTTQTPTASRIKRAGHPRAGVHASMARRNGLPVVPDRPRRICAVRPGLPVLRLAGRRDRFRPLGRDRSHGGCR